MSELFLLDSSVMIALAFGSHIHHDRADAWFQGYSGEFCTCPITQAALVRFALRQPGADSRSARELLHAIVSLPSHVFWPDDLPCSHLPWRALAGHRQVTDAYLVILAKHHGGRLATLDESLAAVFEDALLIPA